MENVSQEREQPKADSGNEKKRCRTTSGSIQLIGNAIHELEEPLTKMQNDLSSLRRNHDVALVESVQLESTQREEEDRIQAGKAALEPLQLELAT